MAKRGTRDIADLPPIPIQNVIFEIRREAGQIERAVNNFRFDVDIVRDVMVDGEVAHPTWKHTSMGAALGRRGEFSEIDVCMYMNARLDRIKKRVAKLMTRLNRQMREYEAQGIRAIRAHKKVGLLTQESSEEWR
jgi:hypothetical protein